MSPWSMLGLLILLVAVAWAFVRIIELIAGPPDDTLTVESLKGMFWDEATNRYYLYGEHTGGPTYYWNTRDREWKRL